MLAKTKCQRGNDRQLNKCCTFNLQYTLISLVTASFWSTNLPFSQTLQCPLSPVPIHFLLKVCVMSLLRFRRLMQPLSRSLAAESVLVLLQWCGRKGWQRQLEVSPKARACRTKLVSSFIATLTAWCCESWPVKVKWGWTWPGSSWLGSSAAPAIGGSASSRLSAPVNNNTDNNKLEELKKTKNDYLSADW